MRGAARRSSIRDRVLLAAVGPVLGGLAVVAVATSAEAATDTWSGGNATSPQWDQPGNWSLGVKPGTGDDALFPSPIPATPGATIVLGAGETANSLTFRDSYTLSGGGLTLTSNNVTVAPTFTATISSVISGAGGVTLAASNGLADPDAQAGGGILLLSGVNTFTGPVLVNAGTLRTGNAAALGTVAGTTTVASGATLDVNGINLGGEIVSVGGAGVGGLGAIINSGAGSNNALRFVTLTSNTTFGGTGRWDIRANTTATLDMGGFNLTKIGANQISLVGLTSTVANPGNIDVQAGIFSVEVNTNLGGSSANQLNLASGTVLQFFGNTTVANAWTINMTGATVRNAQASVSNWAGPVNLTGTGTFDIIANGNTTLSGVIGGTGNLTKITGGTLILSNAANTYAGNTLVSGGQLRATDGSSLPSGTNLSLNGGAFETGVNFTRPLGTGPGQVQLPGGTSGFSANGAPITVALGNASDTLQWGVGSFNPGTLVLNAGTANNTLNFLNPIDLNAGAANVTRTVQANANTATISSLISNSSATNTATLSKTGAGTLVLANAGNTYNGGTTIAGGTLSVGTLPDGAASPIGSGNVTFTGGVLQYTGTASITPARTFTATGGNGGFDIPSATTGNGFEAAGAIPGNTANTFTKSGAGTLTLSGAADNPNLILNAAGGLTQLNKASGSAVHAVGGISNIASGATVKITGGGGDQIHNGDGTTAALGLVNMGGGTLDLNGASEAFGRLNGTGTVTNTAAGSISTLTLGGTAGASNSFAGSINDGPGDAKMAVVKTGAGTTQTLRGNSNYSGGTTVNGGTLAVASNTALGTAKVSLEGGTLQLNGNAVGVGVSFSTGRGGALRTVTGPAGVVPFGNWNNVPGSAGGPVTLNDSNAAPSTAVLTSFSSATNFDVFNNNQANQDLQLLNAYIDTSAAVPNAVVNLDGIPYANYRAYVYVGSDGANRTGSVRVGGTTYFYNTVVATAANPYQLVTSTTSGSPTTGTYAVFNNLSGSALTATAIRGNNNSGIFAVQIVSNTDATAINLANAVEVTADSTIDVAGTTSASIGSLAMGGQTLNVTGGAGVSPVASYALNTGPVTLAGAPTINVANNGPGTGTVMFGNLAGGSNAVTKGGAGTLILAGAGTSTTGAFTVGGGTLKANTSWTATSVTVSAPATLAGTGSITAPVNVSGTVAPGNSVGTLTVSGPVTMLTGSTFAVETANPGFSDLLALTGAGAAGVFDISNVETLNVIPLQSVGATPATYTIATFASSTGTFDVVQVNGVAAQSTDPGAANYVQVVYHPTDIQLNVANVVPEPTGLGLVTVGALGLLARRRRVR